MGSIICNGRVCAKMTHDTAIIPEDMAIQILSHVVVVVVVLVVVGAADDDDDDDDDTNSSRDICCSNNVRVGLSSRV
jgi:hypothetical protein